MFELPYLEAVGVGKHEDAWAVVGCSDVASLKWDWKRRVSLSLELAAHGGKPLVLAVRHVLDHDPLWSLSFNDSRHVRPQARARTLQASSCAGNPSDRDVLAWGPSDDDVDGREAPWVNGGDVVPSGDVRPVPSELLAAEGVDLDLIGDLPDAGPFESTFETSDSGEQGADPKS